MNNPTHFVPNQASNKQAEDELLHGAKLNLLSAASELILKENKVAANKLIGVVSEIETIRYELFNCYRDSDSSASTKTRMKEKSSCPEI